MRVDERMSEERKCYGGQWKVPITPYNQRLYWPPAWIECDCGELAKQSREKKGDHLYPNGATHVTENTRR